MFGLFLFLQTSLTPELGVGGASLTLIGYMVHQQRQSDKRYDNLAQDYRKIVENNTAAMTKLTTLIERE